MDFIKLSIDLGDLSKSIKKNISININKHLIKLFDFCFTVCKIYEINLETAFEKWKKKALQKQYY